MKGLHVFFQVGGKDALATNVIFRVHNRTPRRAGVIEHDCSTFLLWDKPFYWREPGGGCCDMRAFIISYYTKKVV